jgi:oligoendopeptidase F
MSKVKTEWDLKKYYYDSLQDERIAEGINSDLSDLELFVEKYKGNIASLNDEDFLAYMNDSEKLLKNLTKVHYFYSYLNTLDTQDQEVIKKSGELSNIWADASQKLLFIDEEYKNIGYSKFIERSEMEMFSDYKNALFNSADNLKYILTEGQENNLIEMGKVISIFDDMYTELTNSFDFVIDGEPKTKSEVYAMRMSKDESEREKATNALLDKYGEHQIVLGNLYKSVCKENVASVNIRKMEGVMSSRNISEEMDNDVVNTLLDSVKAKYSLYHAHLKNKARIMGKDKLEMHDVFAPIESSAKSDFTFEEGYEFYMDKIKGFDQEFYEYSQKIFEDGRVSVFPKKGKMGGAYASYNKDKESFVMLNHVPDFNSIMTLAHELGHAIHGWYSQEQKGSVYHSPLSLAETASIFNETFVFEEMLKGLPEEDVEFYIMKNLDDIFSTMFRQVMYVDFERECHTRTLNGEELSYEDFNAIWLEKTKEYYGENVNVTDNAKYGWSVIPHIFHTPFYCYSYSFGNILSFNLYKMYKDADNKEEFIEMYKSILKAGGSKRPKDLLIEKGIDITSVDFYNKAFEVVEAFIEQVGKQRV